MTIVGTSKSCDADGLPPVGIRCSGWRSLPQFAFRIQTRPFVFRPLVKLSHRNKTTSPSVCLPYSHLWLNSITETGRLSRLQSITEGLTTLVPQYRQTILCKSPAGHSLWLRCSNVEDASAWEVKLLKISIHIILLITLCRRQAKSNPYVHVSLDSNQRQTAQKSIIRWIFLTVWSFPLMLMGSLTMFVTLIRAFFLISRPAFVMALLSIRRVSLFMILSLRWTSSAPFLDTSIIISGAPFARALFPIQRASYSLFLLHRASVMVLLF